MRATSARRTIACGIALAWLAICCGCSWRPLHRFNRSGDHERHGHKSSSDFISEAPPAARQHRQQLARQPIDEIANERDPETTAAETLEVPPEPPPLESGPAYQTDADMEQAEAETETKTETETTTAAPPQKTLPVATKTLPEEPAEETSRVPVSPPAGLSGDPSETPAADPGAAPVDSEPESPPASASEPVPAPETEAAPRSETDPAAEAEGETQPAPGEATNRSDVGVERTARIAAPIADRNESTEEPTRTKNLDEQWEAALAALITLAKQQADDEAQRGAPGLWVARARDLERLSSLDPGEVNETQPAEPPSADPQPTPSEPLSPPQPVAPLAPAPEARSEAPPQTAPSAPVPPVSLAPPSLEITELAFCRKVEGFGAFEPAAPDAMHAGRSLGLYWEVAGLKSEQVDGWHRTRVGCILEILPASGAEPVWRQALDDAEDRCRRERRDFFINTRLTLPDTLAPGDYFLRLTLRDLQAGASTVRTLAFKVAG